MIRNSSGFTLIEVLLVIGLLTLLLSLGIVSFGQTNTRLRLESSTSQIVSLLTEARTKAMITDTEGQPTSSVYGVHFEADKSILFRGSSFDSQNPNNFVIPADKVTILPNLPCGVPTDCHNVIFTRVSGEVIGFDPVLNWLCLTSGSSSTKLAINFLGVVDVQGSC